MNNEIKLCNCALPSMTGSDECCKHCMRANKNNTINNKYASILEALDEAKYKLLEREYNCPTGSRDNPYWCIVSETAFNLMYEKLDPSEILDFETNIYGRRSFVYYSEYQGWTKIVEQGSSEDCIRY